jgi:hypothetical protein
MNESFKKQNDEDSRKFSKVLTWARNSCTANKIEGAVAGLFKENIVARLEGLAERSQISLPDVKIENASPDNQAVLDEVIRRLEGMERGESNEGASGNPV